MTYFSRALLLGGLLAAVPLRAVYAPIPEQEQGKNLVVAVKAGMSHDSNIFGSANGAVESAYWTLAPRAAYQAFPNQTFVSASYGLTLDHFVSRPGDKLLDSHDASLRVARQFSRQSTLDLYDVLTISRNPESLLAGQRLNTDQSFTRNQLDGRYTMPINAKTTTTMKARSIYFSYRDASLGRSLDRVENLYGLAGDYAFLPEVKVVGEYRHQDVYYRKEGEAKNKSSNYLMAGADYAIAKKLSLSGRLGTEWRRRAAEQDTTSPYVEFSAKYDYARQSFLVGGYAYTIEETSDPERFTDTRLHRVFLNVQHALTALIVASGSATYEPASLQGRQGGGDISEDTLRSGVALSYLPTKNWIVSANFDYDHVRSDDPTRNLRRTRIGMSATYTF